MSLPAAQMGTPPAGDVSGLRTLGVAVFRDANRTARRSSGESRTPLGRLSLADRLIRRLQLTPVR
jgi:hypothetical protein